MLPFFVIFEIILLFGTPIAVGFWLNRRLGLSWLLCAAGALAFVIAWVITSLLQIGGVSSLMISSIAQMGALYMLYRYQLKTVHTEREALMVGAGLGGIELILLSILALLAFLQMLPLQEASDAALISLAARIEDIPEQDVQPSQIDELRNRIDDYWRSPWYEPAIILLQSVAYLPIQMALAVIVLLAHTHTNLRLLFGAMALHFLSRIIPAYGIFLVGAVAGLSLSLLFSGLALWFLYQLRPVVQQQTEVALNAAQSA